MPRAFCVRCKAHDGGFAIAKTVRQPIGLSILLSTVSQFTAKGSGKTHADFVPGKMTVNHARHVISDSIVTANSTSKGRAILEFMQPVRDDRRKCKSEYR